MPRILKEEGPREALAVWESLFQPDWRNHFWIPIPCRLSVGGLLSRSPDITVNCSSSFHVCAWPAIPWSHLPTSSHQPINMQSSAGVGRRIQRAVKGTRDPADRRMVLLLALLLAIISVIRRLILGLVFLFPFFLQQSESLGEDYSRWRLLWGMWDHNCLTHPNQPDTVIL